MLHLLGKSNLFKNMTNIDFFNRVSLAVFDKLYSSFPTPVDLDVKSIAMTITPDHADFEETLTDLQAAEDAIEFLALEGFLTHTQKFLEGGMFPRARLTLKGLAILGSPVSLEEKEKHSLIDGIRKALAGGAKESGAEAVKLLTQRAFAAALAAGPALIAGLSK